MDPVKKLVAERLKTQVAGPHPDAEVLSAFAENALTANERETVLQHLSTCSDCRDIIFLASPLPGDSQQVVSAPRSRPAFALRWGTLAACVVIAAVFLVSRHQAPQHEQLAKSLPQTTSPAAPTATGSIVAAEKTPAELTEMRDKVPAAVHVPANTGHAEPKHITAKPEGNMSFADSGEVSVNAPATLNARVESRAVQSFPVMGRNVANLKQISPGATPAAAAAPAATGTGVGVSGGAAGGVNGLAVGGPTRASNYWYNANSADLTAKKLDAFHGSVSGTIVDPSGAVIPNAKVTALGPFGTTTVISDQAGKYGLDQLSVGNYVLKFVAPGFQEKQLRQVAVLADKPANFDVKLFPGAATETVEVAAAEPIVQQAQQATLQNERQQQSENQIQAQDLEVEAPTIKVQKAARSKDKSRVLSQVGAAQSVTVPAWQWSVSPQGAVQRSNNLGKTWQPVVVKENTVFRAIASVGPEVWVGGNGGVLYHSSDSGLYWTPVSPTVGGEKLQSDITQIQLFDSRHLALTTSSSQVWTTADEGQTWAHK